MAVDSVNLRDFRSYARATVTLAPHLTVVSGPNGAGKTNLLEALYFGATGRSCRTTNDRELVRFGAPATRVALDSTDCDGTPHRFTVAFSPGEPKQATADGVAVERLLDASHRPLVSVFLPDRLELVKGGPALRRAHLDQFVAALWPGRIATRRGYMQSLAQRNALLAGARHRGADRVAAALDAWDAQLARHAMALMRDRREALELLAEPFSAIAARLMFDHEASITYHPRSKATDAEHFVAELQERRQADLERGFTIHGPHRDDMTILRQERDVRVYGSQGQQRLALLSLLLAEREVIGALREEPPLMLLDDVMSELDPARRAALVGVLGADGGQALITTTDPDLVPDAAGPVAVLTVEDGAVIPLTAGLAA